MLRLTGAVPASPAEVLGRIIVKVTMPALLVVILADTRYERALLPALLADIALFTAVALGVLLMRWLRAPRPVQGAAGVVSAFSNTGFLGLPSSSRCSPARAPLRCEWHQELVAAFAAGRPHKALLEVTALPETLELRLTNSGSAWPASARRARKPGRWRRTSTAASQSWVCRGT